MACKVTKTEALPFPARMCFEAAIKTVQGLDWKVSSIDQKKAEIFAATGHSFRSRGELIIIRVNPESAGCIVTMPSELWSQLIGWGKNEDNVKDFFTRLGSETSKIMYSNRSQPIT